MKKNKKIALVLLFILFSIAIAACTNKSSEKPTDNGKNSNTETNGEKTETNSEKAETNGEKAETNGEKAETNGENTDTKSEETGEISGTVMEISQNEIKINRAKTIENDEGEVVATTKKGESVDATTILLSNETIFEISEIVDGDYKNPVIKKATLQDIQKDELINVIGKQNDKKEFLASKIVINKHTTKVSQ